MGGRPGQARWEVDGRGRRGGGGVREEEETAVKEGSGTSLHSDHAYSWTYPRLGTIQGAEAAEEDRKDSMAAHLTPPLFVLILLISLLPSSYLRLVLSSN